MKFHLPACIAVIFLLFLVWNPVLALAQESDSSGDSQTGESSDQEAPDLPEMDLKTIYYTTNQGDSYLLITSDEAKERNRICLVLIPWGEDPEDYLIRTEWTVSSGLDQFQLIGITSDWKNNPEGSDELIQTIFEERSEELLDQNCDLFLIGYEDGADFAMEEAIVHTERYAGLVTIGGEGLSTKRLEELADAKEQFPLNIWMIISQKTSQITRNLSYWKSVNHITGASGSSYRLKFADELYMPATSTAGKITVQESRMGIVLVSRESDYENASVTATISRCFITKVHSDQVTFRDQVSGGEIVGFDNWKFTYNRMQFEGQQRDYWVYTPSRLFTGEDPASLVLCLHGSGGNGEDMIFRTRWHETAEKENIVVLYPSSLYKNGYQHYWQNIDEEISFLMKLVEWACDTYSIDRSRIYVTGYSNGAGMAQNLAVHESAVFAAAALSAPVYFDEDYFGPVEDIHEVAILFSYGSEDKYLDEFQMTAEIDDLPALRHLEYWRGLYGFKQEFYSCEIKGKFTTYTFTNRDQIPVCKWMVVEGKEHSYPQEEVELYYEFLHNYTKGDNGELYYCTELVRSK